MLRSSHKLLGSYLLNQRLFADWWQAGSREVVHQAAKARLSVVLGEDERLSSSALDAQGDEGAGNTSTSTAADARQHAHASGGPSVLRLLEANALVSTFASSQNVQDLSATLQHIREQLGEDLTTFHFHSLLRIFNYHRDRANALQVLEVMVQSGAVTLETYARMADLVHCLSPLDVQVRLMRLVDLAQDAFGTQVMEEDAGSEGATVAAYSASEEGREAREAAAASLPSPSPPSPAETAAAATQPTRPTTCRSAPLLSSLLYHCSTTSHRGTVASCVVTALWIGALGVELTDWDVLAVLTSVLTHADEFPRFCATFGSFDAYERGTVTVQAVVDRLMLLGEVGHVAPPAASTAHADEEREGETGSSGGDAARAARRTREGRTSTGVSSASVLTSLVEAMLTSLRAAGVDAATTVVALPFINAQTHSMEEVVAATLRPLAQCGVGPHRYNAGHLFHALSLVQSSLGDNTGAIRLLLSAAKEQQLQQQQQCDEAQEALDRLASSTGRGAAVGAASSSASKESFGVPVQHLLDVGTLLNSASSTTLRDVKRPFHGALRRVMESQPTTPATSAPSPAELASCAPPLPAARDVERGVGWETLFIRTVAEARVVLRRAVDAATASGGRRPLSRSAQFMFLRLAEFCGRHPPRNPKLTAVGLEERTKWGRYLDARDTSLALFGSARQSRDSMRHLFYNNNQLPELRSEAVIAKDFADVHALFFGAATPSSPASQAELQRSLRSTRTTLPHTGSSGALVPRYLWDPAVHNPYPALQLPINTCSYAGRAGDQDAFTQTEVHQTETDLVGHMDANVSDAADFFPELWAAVLDKAITRGGDEVWYLRNTDMFLQLVRCLLHRLDWEAAADLTRRLTQHTSYTYLMDHALTTVFREIGDPAGCLAFKVATKLFDGRITTDGPAKREKFHQEQFH
ncbi:hypothetical protein NESM_000335300 [Novymonas esmeraldas]|uniref:Uncharacterized protein n=1 Tax=Novymonas esmeraldas TaxID=1808958 RepID=A0AAW0ELA8_9TRYP